MKIANTLLMCLTITLLALVSGCFFGDTVAHRTVSVTLPLPEKRTTVTLSANDTEVQEALRIIDTIVVSNGYVRDSHPISPEDQASGLISSYGLCGVTIRGDKLNVGFVTINKGRLSARAVRASKQLTEKLSSRYGAERVMVSD